MVDDRDLVVLDVGHPIPCCGDVGSQLVDIRNKGDERTPERSDIFELVLRVDQLSRHTLARHLERVELHATRQLLLQFSVDLGADRVQAVQPRFDTLDE